MKENYFRKEIVEGECYESTVPDTLDLAGRAEYAINAITGMLNEKKDYEYIWRITFAPLSGYQHSHQWFDSNTRAGWALTLMRIMTGSSHNLDIEQKMLKSLLSRVGDDGLLYNAPYRADAPWRSGGAEYCRAKRWRTDEDVAAIAGSAGLLVMLTALYEKNGDPAMLGIARKTVNKLCKIAIYKDDYAYYPATVETGLEFAYFKNSGWPDTKKAASELDSPEGTVACYISVIVYALSRWYAVTHDNKSLELARKLVNYILKPWFWMGNIENWDKELGDVFKYHGGLQRKPAALVKAHLAGITYTLQGLIEYAMVANDAYIKEFVRQGYEYMRNFGLARIGMWGENIANNMMAAVAIKLCDAGVGDYWEDVDQIVRNAMVEDQFIDADLLKQECKKRGLPTEAGDFTIERFLGCLRWHGLIDLKGTLDPTQNGVVSAGPYLEPFYFVWESIVRYTDGMAQVNLLLNRASKWLDIDSYLPYQGKVVIKNRVARNIAVRIPCWVDRSKISCGIDGAKIPFSWVGNYMTLLGLQGTEVITVEFPMVETRQTYYLLPWDFEGPWYKNTDCLPKYILYFKGNTCIKAEFPNRDKFATGYSNSDQERGYPVYQREHYRKNIAPMKTVRRYIAPKLVSP